MFEGAGQRMAAALAYLNAHWTVVLAVAVTVLLGYWLAGWVLRGAVPWLAQRLIVPVLVLVLQLVTLALISLQAMVALPFRALRVRPPHAVYRFGEQVLRASAATGAELRWAGLCTNRLRRLSSLALVLLLAAGALIWHYDSCRHAQYSASCRRPVATSVMAITDLWTRIGRIVSR